MKIRFYVVGLFGIYVETRFSFLCGWFWFVYFVKFSFSFDFSLR